MEFGLRTVTVFMAVWRYRAEKYTRVRAVETVIEKVGEAGQFRIASLFQNRRFFILCHCFHDLILGGERGRGEVGIWD
jgi:hypothetical protein